MCGAASASCLAGGQHSADDVRQEKNSPDGLRGEERRFVKFGGGASERQVAWLQDTLRAAAQQGQRAIVCCHLPLLPGTCPPVCLLWNYQEVLAALWEAGNVVATLTGHAHQVLRPVLCPELPPVSHGAHYIHGSEVVRLIGACSTSCLSRDCTNRSFASIILAWMCQLVTTDGVYHIQDGYAVDKHGVHHRVLSAVVETAIGRDCYGIIDMYSDRLELIGFDRMTSAVMPFRDR